MVEPVIGATNRDVGLGSRTLAATRGATIA